MKNLSRQKINCLNAHAYAAIGLVTILLATSRPVCAQNGVWTNKTSGLNWNTAANWTNGIVADGTGATGLADFSQVDIPAGTFTVHLDASHTLTNMIFGDTVVGTAGSWLLDDNGSSGANSLTLSGTSPAITVNTLGTSATATISAVIAGTTAWSKGGAGILVLSGSSTYDAPTTVSGGTLTYSSIGTVGGGASALGSPSTVANGQINLSASSGLLRYNGSVSATTDRTLNIAANNFSIVNDAVSQSLTLNGLITNNGTAIGQVQFRPLGSSAVINLNGQLALGTAIFISNGGLTGNNALNVNNPTSAFTNLVQIASGRLNLASLTNAGLPCAAGAGSVIQINANGAVLGYIGTNNTSSDRLITLGANNAQIANNSPNGSTLTFNGAISNAIGGAGQTVLRGSANTVVNGPLLLSSNFLYKIDFGNVYLNNPTNSFTNYVQIAAGSIYFNSITNGGLPSALGAGKTLYFLPSTASTAHYEYTGGAASCDRTWTIQNVSGGVGPCSIGNFGTGTLTLNGPINGPSANMHREFDFDGTNNITVNGAITLNPDAGYGPLIGAYQIGAGVLTLNNAANSIPGALRAQSGTISVSNFTAIGGAAEIWLGGAGSTGKFQFTGASGGSSSEPILIYDDGTTIGGGIIENTVANQLLALSGSLTTGTLPGPNNSFPASLTLQGAGNGILSADITGSPILSITKTGAGTWKLPGNNTYTGNTVVSNGTLVVNGTIGGGTANATVVAGGTLAGIATIGDAVNVLAGGTLSPGTNGEPDTLTINNNLVLSGAVAIAINKSLAPSNGVVVVSGLITNSGGGSILLNTNGPAFVAGDTFTLFSQAVSNGAAMTITPAPGAGLAWQNNLAVNGSISVVTSGPSGPGYITNSISGNNLTLTWPSGQGWRLVSETNSLSVGLTTNGWNTVPGGIDGSNSITINPNNPTVFYKLVNP
jgi:fibronectin-binding autotransporter adhesin